VCGEAVSSVGPCAPLVCTLSVDASYEKLAWWFEHYDGFGLNEEEYAMLEVATWGRRAERCVMRRRAKVATATQALLSKTTQRSE
jgi:hypothetical protein